MQKTELYSENYQATYCPEDDKLRLYVGRVPRDQYEALRAEGWTSTPKQDCDFVAVWSTRREDTALSYAGYIGDEDQGPAERAADRAERFAGYRESRREDAGYYADRYDAQPMAHGFQNLERAERAAARHDRQADHAVNNWEKAEYWTSRTAGVISNALHKASPGVRMGRIKTLEAEQRQIEARYTPENDKRYNQDGKEYAVCGQGRDRHAVEVSHLETIKDAYRRSLEHLKNRLAYERQMLEAEGGRAGEEDIQAGGLYCGRLILKVNKSAVTGRVVSVGIKVPAVSGWAYKVRNVKGTDFAEMQIDVERARPGDYTPPTAETLAELAGLKAKKKEATPKATPLINPDKESAERLQNWLNAKQADRYSKSSYQPKTASEIREMTSAEYSERSKGTYAMAGTIEFFGAFKVRTDKGSAEMYGARRVIILTDKPQKPLPAFEAFKATEKEMAVTA